MNRETLKYVLRETTEQDLPAVRERACEVPLESGKVVALVGVRRSGKTFIMFQTIHRLVDAGTSRRRIIYLNLEDDRLFPIAPEDMDLILGAHAELYPEEAASGVRYLFLDEVQAVAGWERYARRIHDSGRVRLFITGSSSGVLTRDLAPAMRGRSISMEVFPLSFPEFLSFRGISYTPYRSIDEARIVNALEEYLTWGGLPEIVLADATLRPLILTEYVSLMFFRDLLERYAVRNESVMKLLFMHCCSNPATLVSLNRLHGDLRSRGMQVSKNTLYDYMTYLEDAMLVFTSPRYDRSLRRQGQAPRKVHPVDPALTQAFRARPEDDRGRRLEAAVFLDERRRTKQVFYLSNAHEIDIVSESPGGTRLINSVWSLESASAIRRESESLRWGMDRVQGSSAWLVAHDPAGIRKTSEGSPVVSAWRWLMGIVPASGRPRSRRKPLAR